MNIPYIENVFDRSGLAALSDLNCPVHNNIFSILEKEQDIFLSKEPEFRSKEYKWPRDPLHNWSRVWEYPYVYHALKKHRVVHGSSSLPTVVDLGSGVTFFPFAVAKLGYKVICLDIDDVCKTDIERASSILLENPGKVNFRKIDKDQLPLERSEVDIVYCVSVLEHIQNFETTIDEVFRILKCGGLFIVTIDLDSCGYLDISLKRYYELRNHLLKYFEFQIPEVTIHPMDVLHPRNGPYPYMTYSPVQTWKFHLKQHLKSLFGRKPLKALPDLSVWGGVMVKKRD